MEFFYDKLTLICNSVFGNEPINITGKYSGNINLIFKLNVNNKDYGLRIRVNENIFKYEKNFFKEMAINRWFKYHDKDKLIDEICLFHNNFDEINSNSESNNISPYIIYNDFSRTLIPYPYCIYVWCNGDNLWCHKNKSLYFNAGRKLKEIHSLKFDAFYDDFNSIGINKLDWSMKFNLSIDKEFLILKNYVDGCYFEQIKKFRCKIPSKLVVTPSLVHNDFSGGNILVDNNDIQTIIDWDNAVIDSAELDFIKMKYWTIIDEHGCLVHDNVLFDSFVSGYGVSKDFTRSALFMCYEVLWLTRIVNFEFSKNLNENVKLEKYKLLLNDKIKEYLF